jgi:hypothetical protein
VPSAARSSRRSATSALSRANSPACSTSTPTPSAAATTFQTTPPALLYKGFPNIGNVNQLSSNLNANYNSLQATLRSSGWHGLTSELVYTLSHALDYETGLIPYLPEDSTKQYLEYGNSDFDTRHTFSAVLSYKVPTFAGPERLTHGWELNSALSACTAASPSASSPIPTSSATATAPTAPTSPASRSSMESPTRSSTAPSPGSTPPAFSEPNPGQYGKQGRNKFYNPGFSDVDFSIVKDTRVAEKVNLELRAEMFNLFNRTSTSLP